MSLDVVHQPEQSRFVVLLEGQEGELEYALEGDVATILHTRVPEAIGGRGVAGALNKAAFEAARTLGWRVIPKCSYAEAYVRRHPEYQDLVVGGSVRGAAVL